MKGVWPGMKRINWSYIRLGFLAIVHSTLVMIVLHPWLQLASDHWQFTLSGANLWVLLTMLVFILVVKKAVPKGRKGLPIVLAGFFAPLVLALLLRLKILLFLPMSLGLFLMGLRFGDYPKRARFPLDWALGSMLLIFSSSLEGLLGFEVTAGSVLLFFALGVTALILWNAASLESSGLQPDYRGLSRSIALFVLFVGGVSLGLGIFLSPTFFQGFMGVLYRVYLLVTEVLLLVIVRPFVWLLTPLFRWIENLELEEAPLRLPEGDVFEGELLPSAETPLSPEVVEAVTWIGWVVFVAILLTAVWILVRRFWKRTPREVTSIGQETRESVFSGADVLGDIHTVLKSILRPLSRIVQKKWYQGDDPRLIIRTMYTRFVLRTRRKVPFGPASTPGEYAESLVESGHNPNQEALWSLTELYNDARYGEVADQDAVKRTEGAFREVW